MQGRRLTSATNGVLLDASARSYGLAVDWLRSKRERRKIGEFAKNTAPQEQSAYGAQNKLVSADRAAEIRARLKDKLRNQTSAGIDPEIIALGAELAVFHIEAGSRKFIDMTRAVAADLDVEPKDLKRYLRSWYNGARDMMEDSDVSVGGMDDAETVATLMRSGAIDNLNAKLPETATPITLPPADNETNEATENEPESEPLRVDPPQALEGLAPDRLQGNEGGRETEPDGTADRPLDSRQRTEDDGAGDAGGRGRGVRSGRAVSRPRKKPVNDSQPALDFAAAQSEQIADTSRQNFRVTKDLHLGQGGPTEKFNDNVAAIETLKQIEAENRPATASEQAILVRYVGWGGLKNAFPVGARYFSFKHLFLNEKILYCILFTHRNAHPSDLGSGFITSK